MVPSIRAAYNSNFTNEIYEAYLADLHSKHTGSLDFRVAETPIFIDKAFKEKF